MRQQFTRLCKLAIALYITTIFATAPLSAFAENITYTGDGTILKNGDLYPGDGLAPSLGNTVIINYAPGAGADPKTAHGGYSINHDASHNILIMHNGNVTGVFYGGDTKNGNAMHNAVSINGGTVNGVIYGGSVSDAGNATHNRVNINGGTAKANIYGGYTTSTGNATHNIITINGGTVENQVVGGLSMLGDATHNTINIGAGANATATVTVGLVGGLATNGDGFSGNTLNVYGYTTGADRISKIANFENLNFTLPANINSGSTILRASSVNLNQHGAGRESDISVSIMGGGRIQQRGEIYTLIDATWQWNGGNIAQSGETIFGRKGVSLLYEFKISESNPGAVTGPNTVNAEILNIRANPQAKALLQAQNAAMLNINRGGDLSSGYGMDSAKASAKKGVRTFFAASGSLIEQETGSKIELDGASLMAGVAWGGKVRASEITVGAFVEAGMGSYDSHNSFSGLSSVDGSGDTQYFGGGVLASFEATSGFDPIRGFHADASIRGGYVESDFSGDLSNYGQKAEFEPSAYYLGAHLAAGYAFKIGKSSTLDAYAKYLWAHIASDEATILGDKFKFDSADSHRVRGGLRYAQRFGAIKPYLGAAYEYELDGEAGGKVYNYSMTKTDMSGGTAIGELGFAYAASKNFSASLAAEGYMGKRDGFGGSFKLIYKF